MKEEEEEEDTKGLHDRRTKDKGKRKGYVSSDYYNKTSP